MTGRQSRTRAAYRLHENIFAAGRNHHSKPEVMFNLYQESRDMGLVWDKQPPPVFFDPESRSNVPLQCDFLRPIKFHEPMFVPFYSDVPFDLDIEVDGAAYHKTKTVNGVVVGAGKDAWKDELKRLAGVRVLHIPAELPMKKTHWAYLDSEITRFLSSDSAVRYIDG